MNITLSPFVPCGRIRAISSKSAAHRILICAAFADRPTVIRCDTLNNDIEATASCLRVLGANIRYEAPHFYVTPVSEPQNGAVLDCGESGSTLRFLLPVIPALGVNASFKMAGRLPERPLSPLYEELVRHGARFSAHGTNPLTSCGKLTGGEYKIRGDVSSQFISGLLLALTVSGLGGQITVEGKFESEAYVKMTADALSLFGAPPQETDYGYFVPSRAVLRSPDMLEVEGDWSGAAFPLCMGALGTEDVTVYGLNENSTQGDKAIVDILRRFGADVTCSNGEVTVHGGAPLRSIDIDASQIPDLVPVLATVASVSKGRTVIYGASRLRLKESDRLAAVSALLNGLGADVLQTDDGLTVNGCARLKGGVADSCNDHRIAMSAAVAAVASVGTVTVTGAECVSKSYPDFWNELPTFLKKKKR